MEQGVGHHGTFEVHGLKVWGELTLSGLNSQLKLRTEERPTGLNPSDVIHGQLHDFTFVSCVRCVGGGEPTRSWGGDDKSALSWNVFPHQVLSGCTYFNPEKDRIQKVWFSTGDIYHIFDDFDSFGTLLDPAIELRSSIPNTVGSRQVHIGDDAIFTYFAGRSTLLEASLSFGKFEVRHSPWAQWDSQGARITTQMRIQVEFSQAVSLDECLGKVASICQFLSLIAGRPQSAERVQIEVAGQSSNVLPLALHWSLVPQQVNCQEIDTPSWIDMPLDGVRRADEFRHVMEQWFSVSGLLTPPLREATNADGFWDGGNRRLISRQASP